MSNSQINKILTQYWGHTAFRPLQEDIINSVLNGKDTLALLPTGGGKSICFQVPALAQEGICLVISPLIALMKDQVQNLQKRDIKAAAIYSGMSRREIDITLDNCAYGDYKFLYISPERLETEIFRERVKKMNVNLLAVDEAHCISQWGYDFRPPYLRIADIREHLPDTPVLALTATATPEVKKDIQEKLQFKKENVFQKSFERTNLAYVVRYEEGKLNKLLEIFQKVKGTGIVYARNRKKTKDIAEFLQKKGIRADFYHAGLDVQARSRKQEEWINNKTRVMACTNAFGMGIDKPDVRVVVHMDLPDSLEAYYQEAGRAGRDEKKAYAALLYHPSDAEELQRQLKVSYPEVKEIKRIYQALGNYLQIAVGAGEGQSFNFIISDFCSTFNLDPLTTYSALKILEQEDWISLSEAVYTPSRILIRVSSEELYKFEIANKNYEPVIKVLLRSYSGIFDHFTNIKEADIARILKIPVEKIIQQLRQLEKMNLIIYEAQKDKPQLTFLHPRADESNFRINVKHLNERKKNYARKIEAVINYAEGRDKCRSQQLLAYFGEYVSHRCGQCDVCLKRNELGLSDYEFEQIEQQIKEKTKEQSLSLKTIINDIPQKEEKVVKVVQWMMDNNLLKLNEKNEIELLRRQ